MSTSLKLLGATLTSNSTTSLADFSNFAKVKIAASNADDAAARNDYVNQKITVLSDRVDNGFLKLDSSTQTISGGAITVNKSYEKLIVSGSNNILSNINAGNTLQDGMIVVLQASDPSSSITVNHSRSIRLKDKSNCILTGYNTLQLLYSSVSNSWIELNRTVIAAPTAPTLSLADIIKKAQSLSFPLTSLVTKTGTGVLSFSLSNNTGVATIAGDTVSIVGAGTATINVSIAASDDGLYAQGTTSATLTVETLALDANNVTIKSTLSSLSSSPTFIQANLRGTLEWFAVVNDSSKTYITNYAKGIATDGSSKFIPTGQTSTLPPVPFNNIVTTFMTDMSNMFYSAYTFNTDISSWDTSRVTDMFGMFYYALEFNKNIGSWNTSNVTNMQAMFYAAVLFNQNISSWNVTKVVTKPNFSTSSALDNSPTYIPYWSGIGLDANGVTVKSTLPSLSSSPTFIQANLRGTLEWFAVVNQSSKTYITNYANGETAGINYFTPSGQTPAVTTPVLFNNIVTTFMTDMSSLFDSASTFNDNISSWDTSKVTTMGDMFFGASIFNSNIGSWDTSNVTDMSYMFYGAKVFNQNIGLWNTSNVTKMQAMFYYAFVFNQNIGSWITYNVTDMSYMFGNAKAFNQNISSWNVTKVDRKPPSNFSTGSALDSNNAYKPVGFY
jgi:surface protein